MAVVRLSHVRLHPSRSSRAPWRASCSLWSPRDNEVGGGQRRPHAEGCLEKMWRCTGVAVEQTLAGGRSSTLLRLDEQCRWADMSPSSPSHCRVLGLGEVLDVRYDEFCHPIFSDSRGLMDSETPRIASGAIKYCSNHDEGWNAPGTSQLASLYTPFHIEPSYPHQDLQVGPNPPLRPS